MKPSSNLLHAEPKSIILRWFWEALVNKIFSGFRSQWITCDCFSYMRPSSIYFAIWVIFCFLMWIYVLWIHLYKLTSKSSNTMAKWPLKSKYSFISTTSPLMPQLLMFYFTLSRCYASFFELLMSCSFCLLIFIATISLVFMSLHLATEPKAPASITFWTQYL